MKTHIVLFYSKKLMADGHVHHSVGSYNSISQIASYPSDYINIIKEREN